MRDILVTGGAGFIGSHLCDRLISDGRRVICLDNFRTGREENIRHLRSHPHFTLLRHDLTQPIPCAGADAIYHLACPASPIHYQSDPIQTTRTNVLGSLNALDLARRNGARILFASTSEVYGDPQIHPQPESYWGHVNPIGPRSCYDEGKRCAESLFFDYQRQHDVDIKVVRIFNTFGPRMRPDDGRVVSTFICQALTGADLTIHGDGSHSRSFCYVDDLINGLIAMMGSPREIHGPINLGNPEELSIARLAQIILDATASPSKVIHNALPQDDPRQRRPDITMAMRMLDWRPRTDLATALHHTISHFREVLGGQCKPVEADRHLRPSPAL
jgi:UDP-glucuronate decarboxylase